MAVVEKIQKRKTLYFWEQRYRVASYNEEGQFVRAHLFYTLRGATKFKNANVWKDIEVQ